MPARPAPSGVKVLSVEDKGEYTLERFEFFNGVDMTVPQTAAPSELVADSDRIALPV